MIKGTEQQEEIWKEIEEGNSHMVVNAGAGTGKTFTIVEGANRLKNAKTAFLCFNKSIKVELSERLPQNVEAKTFHAFGFAAIRNAGIRTKVNNYKVKNIIDEILGKDFNAYPLVKLISLIKGSMIEGDDLRSIRMLIDKYNIQFDSDREESIAIDTIPYVLTECLSQTHVIDFDDMIWLPLKKDLPFPKYEVLFVDEAQDFNEMQRQLIFRCIGDGRCIVVGDKNQAIYGFRGADSDSMNVFSKQLLKTNREIKEFPLSLTWRCPKSVVAEANRYVEDFHCRDIAEDGTVTVNAGFNPSEGDMVLCRYNAPLVGAFYDLIIQGKSAYVQGRDMTTGLINYVNKITKNKSMGMQEFVHLLDTDFNTQYSRLMRIDKINQANSLEDKYNCLKIFCSKTETVGDIHDEIKNVFSGDKGEIMLSTVHKAKGLEADNVYILATERMPHPKANDRREELNICYVAITRAKKNLFYCGPKPAN